MNALLLSALVLAADTPPQGVLPTGADGLPLNFDFETGTLKDWTADGPAFAGMPVKGDVVARRRGDMRSRHQGEFWVGGWERAGDKPTGTLTSAVFTVEHPWASFRVGGGSHTETCVELIVQPRNEVVFRASGLDEEDLRPVAVDLTKHVGKQMQIRLVDRHTGHWGHVNFDDFRFHSKKPNVPDRPGKEPPAKPDEYRFAGLAPEAAAAAMTVPEGFTVTLFAGEPDVHQPVAMCLDDRGRLWVAEAYAYPKRLPFPGPLLPADQAKKGDRILIFEDSNGDGKFDKRTVFQEGLNLVSGLEVGFGGVWVGAAPYLMFIPDKDHDDKPDAAPQIMLDGWGLEDTHETLNSFIWGPDGWLYGCHGVFTKSRVGKPGTPDAERIPINAGVWRYHPTRHVFEVFAHGTSNPWGLDYNDVGDFFVEACVIPHCFHIVQGGRYIRQAGSHFNPYTYTEIPTIADHLHYVGNNPHGGNNRSNDAGGGHAHCGLMCYLGGAWPKEYRGQLFMGNIHGRRLNVDIPVPKGSGYVAKHGKDFLLANDAWARFINFRYGPDGNVYLIDWYDKQACHRPEPEIWDRTNGRVFKISYRGAKPVTGIDLQKCSDAELVQYQLHENDWFVRHARRVLQERADTAKRQPQNRFGATRQALGQIASEHADPARRLRALWALQAMGGLNTTWAAAGLADQSQHVRAWTCQFILEDERDREEWLEKLAELAQHDTSAVVRRAIAGGLQRLSVDQRWAVHRWLIRHPTDADDPNLPYLNWYAGEPFAAADPKRAMHEANHTVLLSYLEMMARRTATTGTPEAYAGVVARLNRAGSEPKVLAILRGLAAGLVGQRSAVAPAEWSAVYTDLRQSPNAEVRSLALTIGVRFRDPAAAAVLLDVAADPKGDPASRQAALASLLDVGHNRLGGLLKTLVNDPLLRPAAIRGLARVQDDDAPAVLLGVYPSLRPAEKRDAVNTLASRPAYAVALLDAIGAKQIPAADVPAETVRQLRNLGDKAIDAKIVAVWGTVRESPAERKKLIGDWTRKLNNPPAPPDLSAGRAVYAKVCQQCHTLYGVGGKVGPDITGSNRADAAYILENVFDPSAVIPKEYAATKLDLVDGRVLTGIVKEETKMTLTVVTATETLTVPAADVEKRTPSDLSMMPDDLTKQLNEGELRALFAYLRHPAQVPIAATAENAKEFFNGRDLAGWDGDKSLWRVENGEIVGKTAGLKRNNFLVSQMAVGDFKLTLKMKLSPNAENSGIQFRSEPLPDGEMRGPQADAGAGWWGKLYEEGGRGLLWKESGEKHVKLDDWNEYVIEATGSRVRTWINGQPCVDLDDPKLSRRGVVGLQMHSGKALEVRFKDVKLEVK